MHDFPLPILDFNRELIDQLSVLMQVSAADIFGPLWLGGTP